MSQGVLRDRDARVLALLRKLQHRDVGGFAVCACCGRDHHWNTCTPDCELAELVRELEGGS